MPLTYKKALNEDIKIKEYALNSFELCCLEHCILHLKVKTL